MTTKPPKTFDCVQMKWGIQERIQKELAGLTPEQRRLAGQRRVQEDPILGPFMRQIVAAPRSAPNSAPTEDLEAVP